MVKSQQRIKGKGQLLDLPGTTMSIPTRSCSFLKRFALNLTGSEDAACAVGSHLPTLR
jgi:hypothetical protein